MKIFISHSTRNKEIVDLFAEFLESVDSNIDVFYTSEARTIGVGKDFIKTIFYELDQSDIFIPIISREYYESRFCMFEMGVAYSYLYNKYQKRGEDYIFPFAIYPLTKGEALSGTPIPNIQVGEINNEDDIRSLLDYLKLEKGMSIGPGTNRKIHSVKTEMDQHIIKKQNIILLANIFTYFDDKVSVNNENDIADWSLNGYDLTVNYNMNPYDDPSAIYPNFISVVLKYVDGLNLLRYLDFNEDAAMKFVVTNFTNSLKNICVEFKYSSNIQILRKYSFSLSEGRNSITVPLREMRSNALSDISEICFVIHPNDVIEKEGMFKVENVEIS